LAKQILAWENHTTTDQITDEEGTEVLTDLYHNHLPKLADAGVIKYDPQTLTVRLLDQTELFTTVVRFAKRIEDGMDM